MALPDMKSRYRFPYHTILICLIYKVTWTSLTEKNTLFILYLVTYPVRLFLHNTPDSKVHGSNMGPIWGRQDPGGPHDGPMNLAIWECLNILLINFSQLNITFQKSSANVHINWWQDECSASIIRTRQKMFRRVILSSENPFKLLCLNNNHIQFNRQLRKTNKARYENK